MEDFFKRTLERNLLKYSAGSEIFCPGCGQVADCKRWVVVSRGKRSAGLCATCWDKVSGLYRVDEIVDGRVVFARTYKAKEVS